MLLLYTLFVKGTAEAIAAAFVLSIHFIDLWG